jgi:hypothetical protein
MAPPSATPEDQLSPWIVIGVSLVPAVIFIGFVMAFDTFELPGRNYYATAAQVIPVLVVALALEARAQKVFPNDQPARTALKIQLFLFLLLGEAAAFLGMSGALGGEGTSRDHTHPHVNGAEEGMVATTDFLSNLLAALTGAGLIGGFLVVVLVAIFAPARETG